MKKIVSLTICTIVTIVLFSSCGDLFDPEKMNHAHFQVVNLSSDTVRYSFFAHKNDRKLCIRMRSTPILPLDTIHGGLGFYRGEDNSWSDYFDKSGIDTFYVVISTKPLEVQENKMYDSLPYDSNSQKTYKYVKKNFEGMNSSTDIVTFIYP